MVHQKKLRCTGMTIPMFHDHEISRRQVDWIGPQCPAGYRGRDDMFRNNCRARTCFYGLADRFIVGQDQKNIQVVERQSLSRRKFLKYMASP